MLLNDFWIPTPSYFWRHFSISTFIFCLCKSKYVASLWVFFLLHIYFIFTVVLWLKPSRQLRPTQLLTPCQQHEGENRKGKSKKTHQLRDKTNLISEAKAVCASKTMYGIHSLFPIDRQVSSHFQESRASAHIMVTWEDTCHNCKWPFSCPWAFIAEHDMIGYGTSPWSVEVNCPCCVPSQPLAHLQPTHCRKERKPWGCAGTAQQQSKH